LPIGMCG